MKKLLTLAFLLSLFSSSSYLLAQQNTQLLRDSAMLYHKKGNSKYGTNATKAIQFFKQSITIRKQVLEQMEDSIDLAKSYQNIGVLYDRNHDFDQALMYLDTALKIRQNYIDQEPFEAFLSYRAIADCLDDSGDYLRAEGYYLKALSILDTYKIENKLAGTLQNLALLYLNNGAPEKALKILNRLDSFDLDGYEKADNKLNKGIAYDELLQWEKALDNYEQALKFYRTANDTTYIKSSLNNIGIIQRKKLQFAQAKSTFQEILSLLKEQQKQTFHPEYSTAFHNLGDVYFEEGLLDSARHFYDISLVNFFNGSRESRPSLANLPQTGSPISLLTFQQSKGILLLNYYKKNGDTALLLEAIATFKYCEEIIQSLRTGHSDDRSKLFWQAQTRPLYENAIEAALLADQADLAFHFAENAKATLLLESLNELDAHKLANIPSGLSKQEKELRDKIIGLETQLQGATNAKSKEKIQQDLFAAKEAFLEFQKKLENDFPKYFQAKYDTSIVGADQVRESLLDDKTAMLEYVVSDSAIFVLCLHKSSIETYETKWNLQMDKDFAILLDFLGKQGTNFEDYTRIGYGMYEKLLSPALADLPKTVEKLVIVPDGFLAYLPFEALLSEPVVRENPEYKTLPYLFHDFAIAYGYSANVLAKNKQAVPSGAPRVLAMAPSFSQHGHLPDLKYSIEEIQAVLDLFPGRPLAGDARRDSLLQLVKLYEILYLSTHATAGRQNALDNRIYLDQGDSLSLNEVQYLALENLNTRMIVLSACETGRGELLRGEGVWSMGRSFATIGIPNVLMSLWLVNEKSTRRLMEFYFQSLKKGEEKSVALQAARKQYFLDDETSGFHPYYWAAFVSYGDDGALLEKSGWSWWFLGLGFLAILGLYFWRRN